MDDIGSSVRYGEAVKLTQSLMRDPTSWLHAAVASWDYPLSREGIAILDLLDLQNARTVPKRNQYKPSPRPWPTSTRTKLGGKKKRTARETLAILRPMG